MMFLKKITFLCAITVLALFINACSNVKPWQKEYLATPQMSLESSTPLAVDFQQSVYKSRAASQGGYSIGGGGCGCD